MGADLSDPSGFSRPLHSPGGCDPEVRGERALGRQSRLRLALAAGGIRRLEQRLQAFRTLAGKGRLAGVAQGPERRCRS